MSVTVGVIGCGSISRFHFSGLEKANARVAWVCDVREEAARPWKEQFSARWTPEVAEVLADDGVDAVHITTPSATHPAICRAAIEAGKAVICEKTLTASADDSLAIVRLAEERRTLFYTSYMKRFIPAVEEAKKRLPDLGRILSTHVRGYQCWGVSWDRLPPDHLMYRASAEASSPLMRLHGGGILTCGGSHLLDLIGFLLGRPERLTAAMRNPAHSDCDAHTAALIETPKGLVHFDVMAHNQPRIGFLRDGWDERIEINGERGRIEILSSAWDATETKASRLVHYDAQRGVSEEVRYEPASPFDRAVAHFHRQIEQGAQGPQSPLTGYDVDELIAHIKESATCGGTVNVNWRIGPTAKESETTRRNDEAERISASKEDRF